MRTLLLLAFLFTGYFAEGQNVDSISKIIFRYGIGGNSFGQAGVYDREEIIEIKHLHDNFKISKYQEIIRTYKGDGSKSISDTSDFSVEGYGIIPKTKIERLFISLNTTKDNFDSTFVIRYLSKPTKGNLIKISKQSDLYYKFDYEDKDSDSRQERNNKIRKIQSFDKLAYFLSVNKPDPDLMSVTVDAWNFMRISCITKKDTTIFDSELSKLMGQPIDKYKKGSREFPKGVVNLEINRIIIDLLPKSSSLRKKIDLNSLTDEYIKWYLKEEI